MSQFTEGPWTAEKARGVWRIWRDNEIIATIRRWSKDVDEADAYLIAAAPDLLTALKGLLAPEPGGVFCSSELIHAARAAVAKAEGQEQSISPDRTDP